MKRSMCHMVCAATAGALLLGGPTCTLSAKDGSSPQRFQDSAPVGGEPEPAFTHAFNPPSRRYDLAAGSRIKVLPRGGLVVAEHGNSAAVAVFLAHKPNGAVVLRVSSTAPGEGVPDAETLRFTPENWATPQVLRVQGIDDPQHDGDQHFRIRMKVDPDATTDRTGFAGQTVLEVTATNLDDEGLLAEGSQAEPLDITLLLPAYRGQVGRGESHYLVRNRAGPNGHTVHLTDLGGDADVFVYSDRAFSRPLCRSKAHGTQAERCVAGNAEVLYIKVSGKSSGGGARYIMDVR